MSGRQQWIKSRLNKAMNKCKVLKIKMFAEGWVV